MTGIRPTVSVILPEKGRENPAVKVKRAMMSPMYCLPPILLRKSGSSGIIIWKEAENKKLLVQSNQNWVVKIEVRCCIYKGKTSNFQMIV